MPALSSLGRLVVISPHLDDAVLSCGGLLASHPGALVITVCTGVATAGTPLTDWDARCGFDNALDAVSARREEDRLALDSLHARAAWLDLLDSQYGGQECPKAIAEALLPLIPASGPEAPETVLMPLGLFHADHERVHDAALIVRHARPELRWLAYEDVPYRRIPGLLQQRLMVLAQAGIRATPQRLSLPDRAVDKARAVGAYASQCHAFGPGGLDDTRSPERFWFLDDGPALKETAHA